MKKEDKKEAKFEDSSLLDAKHVENQIDGYKWAREQLNKKTISREDIALIISCIALILSTLLLILRLR